MNINNKVRGFACGAVATATYGMNPLFTLPLYKEKMPVDFALLCRYGSTVLILGILMKIQGQSFILKRSEILPLATGGLFFSASSLLLSLSHKHIDADIASTILFVYPVMVALVMLLLLHEKVSLLIVFYILLVLSGIRLFYKGGGGKTLSPVGTLLIILSSLSYAVYIVGVNYSTLRSMSTARLTFYALLFGLSIYIVHLNFCADLQAVPSPPAWDNILAMASLPTIISLVCTAVSIHGIGSTPTVILGTLEPVTALFFGVMIFGEWLTPRLVLGIPVILAAVMFIVMDKPLITFIKEELVRGMKKKLIG